MGFRFLLIIFLLSINLAYSNIVYDKNGISISEIEIETFKNLYQEFYQQKISNNFAKKNIILMKKTIKYLEDYNQKFISLLNESIKEEHGLDVEKKIILYDFLRFQKIRNEFISDYYQNQFDIDDLRLIFTYFEELNLPLSENKCFTIERLNNLKDDEYFLNNFFYKFKNNKQEYKTNINGKDFDVCISIEIFNKIDNQIYNFIQNKTEKNFLDFIYGKIS